MKNICLLDLNYTLVGNQADTRLLRPFTRRMAAEEYRADLIEAIRDDYVIIVTAGIQGTCPQKLDFPQAW